MIYTAKKNKLLRSVVFFITLSLLILVLIGFYLFKSRIPQMSGEIELRGLLEKVEIIRDQNGVVHINANNTEDAYFALGHTMASERLFQMDLARRMANGELSEIIGEKTLKSDKLFRNLGLKRQARKLIAKNLSESLYDPEMLKEVNAFYAGINSFIDTGKLPVEYIILNARPAHFSLEDSYSFIGVMGFSFGISIMTEPLLTDLTKRLGHELVEDLRIEQLKNEKAVTALNSQGIQNIQESLIATELQKVISFLEEGHQLFEGSNGWLISGQRSKTGFPILANDPHISFSHPGVWFEAHIKTPNYETYGHFLPAIPFPILSHNKERAWGLTMTLTDDMDVYDENVDYLTETYFFKDQTLPLKLDKEIIKVKNKEDVELKVYSTHHGPILHSLSETMHNEDAYSFQWAFYNMNNDPLSAVYKMDRAKSMQEFKAAVALGISPGLNILYADKKNIGWWMFGEVWKKKTGLKRDFILDGQSGEDEILGVLDFSEKPHLENPKNGIIVSANQRPNGYPEEIRGDWQPSDRYETILAILEQKPKWSVEETKELQALNMNFENKKIINSLIKGVDLAGDVHKYSEILDILISWDLVSNEDSVAPSIYYSWIKEIQILLLKDLTADEREIFAKVPNGWAFMKRVINNPESAWWNRFNRGNLLKEALDNSVAHLSKKFGPSPRDWKWGRIHTITFNHPLGQVKPLNYIFNLGPYPVGGATQEINNMKYSTFKEDFPVSAGPSTRRIIDFSHPERSLGILPVGNSGHLLSPFYKNDLPKFLKGEYREQILDLKKEDIYSELILNPIK